MFKFFRFILKITLSLIALIFIATLGIVLFVNPNQFKPTIEETAFNKTGHVLTIDGPLSWHWLPMLSLEIKNVALKNAKPFSGTLFSANSVKAEIEPWSLFLGKIVLDIKLEEVNLDLIKNKEGKNNWESLQKAFATKESPTPSKSALDVLLNGVTIKNASLGYQDALAGKAYKINQVNLSAANIFKGIVGLSNAFSMDMQLIGANKKSLGQMFLSGNWALRSTLNDIDIKDLDFSFKFPNGKSTRLTGEISVENIKQLPMIEGSITGSNIDPNILLSSETATTQYPIISAINTTFKYEKSILDISTLNMNLNNGGTLESHFNLDLANPSLKEIKANGKYLVKNFNLDKLLLDQIKGNVVLKQGILNLDPIELQIAKTHQHASAKIDLQNENLKYAFALSGNDFDINNLLSLLGNSGKLEGKTNYQINIYANGTSADSIKKSLSGNGQITINQGKLYGINLPEALEITQDSLYKFIAALTQTSGFNIKDITNLLQDKWQNPLNPHASTGFETAKASIQINNGVITNPDLSITGPKYRITGNGNANLTNESIRYQTSVLYDGGKTAIRTDDKIVAFLSNTPLTLQISGTFNSPSIRPDINSYVNQALGFAQKNVIQNVIEKHLDKAIKKGVGGENNPGIDKAINQLFEHLK